MASLADKLCGGTVTTLSALKTTSVTSCKTSNDFCSSYVSLAYGDVRLSLVGPLEACELLGVSDEMQESAVLSGVAGPHFEGSRSHSEGSKPLSLSGSGVWLAGGCEISKISKLLVGGVDFGEKNVSSFLSEVKSIHLTVSSCK